MADHTIFDWSRRQRTGVPEVVFAQSKTIDQLLDILDAHEQRDEPLLMTRLTVGQLDALQDRRLDLNATARTAVSRMPDIASDAPRLAIIAAGTSDLPVAQECRVSANYLGLRTRLHADVGVAGLWRLEGILPDLADADLIVACAGMEGALFSVIAGLVPTAVIAVPTSVGYGVSKAGKAALSSALGSCAPGIVTVNIDNGFGAAAAARKLLKHRFAEEV